MDKAQTIHLPNIVFRLVRNSPKEANNPFIATFRVPVQLTKPDIVSYLWQVYGLKVTSISTIIEMGEKLVRPDLHIHRRRKSTKKAIVGLEQPFWFPETRSAAWLEDHFEKWVGLEGHYGGQQSYLTLTNLRILTSLLLCACVCTSTIPSCFHCSPHPPSSAAVSTTTMPSTHPT